jgi:hypothetical protein
LGWSGINKGFLLLRYGKNGSKVLVIYTGGTIGMVRNEQGVLASGNVKTSPRFWSATPLEPLVWS